MALIDDIAILTRQERELILPHFNEEVAWQLGVRLREMAAARGAGVAIEVRRFGQPLFYAALPGSSPDHAEWVRRKGNVVARFYRSSYRLGLELQQRQASLGEKYGLPATDFAAHGGSFPLHIIGAGMVGTLTVSGLTQRADHELVVECLCGHCGKSYSDLALGPAS